MSSKGKGAVPIEETVDETQCIAIAVANVESGVGRIGQDLAESSIREALTTEQFSIRYGKNDVFVCNELALPFAQFVDVVEELKSKVTTQNNTIELQNSRLREYEEHNAVYHDRVKHLKYSSEGFKQIRSRFISRYKRDKLHYADGTDYKIIGEGNQAAHGGDGAFDAFLYSGDGGRKDKSVFEKLYGLPPLTVQAITHAPTINALNLHARISASTTEIGSPTFYKLFQDFIKAFEETGIGYDETYLDGPATAVTYAYYAFIGSEGSEVTKVKQSK